MLHTNLSGTLQRNVRRLGLDRAAGVQTAIWLLLVALVVQTRLPEPDSANLFYYLLLLTICGVAAAVILNGGVWESRPAARPVARQGASALPHWTWAGAAAGVVCGAIGARLAGPDEWNAQWWWLAAVVIPVLTLLAARVPSLLRARSIRLDPVIFAEVAALFVIAFALRAINIISSPPFLLGDESSCGLYGRLFNAGHTPLLSISWFGLPMFSWAVSGVGLRIFGDDFAGLRLINAVIGSLGVVLTYGLGKEWFSRRAGLLAAILLSFAFLNLELSRDGISYIQGPVSITLTLYLFTLWIKRGGAITALLSGMSLALAVQVYWSARVVFFIVPAMLLFAFLSNRALLLSRWREMIWTAAGALSAGLPVWGLFAANPASFNGHQGEVSIFSSSIDLKNHLISQYGNAGMVSIVLTQSWKVLTAFNSRPDASIIFDVWGKPMLDAVSAALLPAAAALALVRFRRWEYLTCIVWIGMVMAASAVTIDPPLWGRFASLTPAVALLLGALLAEIWVQLEPRVRWPRVVGAGIALVLVASAVPNLKGAFSDYPNAALQTRMGPTDVGNFLAHAPGATETVLLSDGSFYVTYEPIRFLAPNASGCTLMPGQTLSQCPVAQTSKLFVLLPGRVSDLAWLERQRPGGKVVTVGVMGDGSARILAYELT